MFKMKCKSYLVLLMIMINFLLFACNINTSKPEVYAGKVWQTKGYGDDGNYAPVLADGVIYQPEAMTGGISATSQVDGKVIWQIKDKFAPHSNVLLSGNRLYIFSKAYKNEDANLSTEQYLWVLDKNTGDFLARVTLDGIPGIFQYEWWLTIHQGIIYFQCGDNNDTPAVGFICKLAESDIQLTGDVDQKLPVSVFYRPDKLQRAGVVPLFEQDHLYLFLEGNGWRGPLPAGETFVDGYYYQESVQVICIKTDGTIVWKTTLKYAGMYSTNLQITINGDSLLLGDYSGRACINKIDGSIVWEQKGESTCRKLVLSEGRIYSTCLNSVLCFNASDGALLWEYKSNFSVDSNPIIRNGKVYCIMSDALRVFDAVKGTLLYTSYEWGCPGYRSQGYIMQQDDTIYYSISDNLVALKLRN